MGIVTDEPFERLGNLGVVPVVEITDARQAATLARTLLEAGLPCLEVTMRTAVALEAIRVIRRECPGMLLGAGTVRSPLMAEAAVHAGASFLVAPGFHPSVVDRALEIGVTIIPGVCTPTEIDLALDRGFSTLKFFPAEVAGGTRFLRAVDAVYPEARFIPTGGIEPGNLGDYLKLRNVLACGGSWMVKRSLLDLRDWSGISKLARAAVSLAAEVRPHAVGDANVRS